ncbi:DUF4886 domain-containing protein [Pedobacter mucosus]|uniref:DUF4886 domain-containing protein n=1 Tax=Pedobacter mucosus TaxID=2895286 RepID=UPI001EE4987E|nr:DUF4886 domain-containing protein [Pedobacter mucosus]UKT64946.1 DUF4886 domain-containing protein [Pedobacter mucosus]
MKTLIKFYVVSFLTILLGLQLHAQTNKTLRVLMIGNSFSQNATRFLPQMAAEVNTKIIFGRAEMGGCSLQRHWDSVVVNNLDTSRGKAYNGKSLKQLLSSQKWDVVTLQQYSLLSGDEATYFPYAKNLFDLVKSYQPSTQVIIHQTWAYRADAKSFGKISNEKRAKNQEEMWQKSRAAYHKMAAMLGNLNILPSGDAFYNIATDKKWSFVKDANYDYKNPLYPALPNEKNSINVGYTFGDDKKLKFDPNHANDAGCYLAGLIWYKMLLKQDPIKLAFKPKTVDDDFSKFLKETAVNTIDGSERK